MTTSDHWPPGCRCGVAFTVDLDAESVDFGRAPAANLWGRFSHGRYGIRVGVYRLLEIFREHAVPATFFVPAWDAERIPELVETILAAGHEVAAHGYAHEDHSSLEEAERDILEKAHQILTHLTGRAPVGWRAPGGRLSLRTLAHLVDLGYQYDASFYDDDLPHELECGEGRRIIEIPQFPFLNDTPFYQVFRPPLEVGRMWLEELEAIYDEGLFYSLKLHPRGDTGSGRALRAAVVDEVCRAVRRRSGTWVTTHAEIADWWRKSHERSQSGPSPRTP